MRANFTATVFTGFLVWACAKANDSTLLGRGMQVAGKGGGGSGGSASGGAGRGGSATSGTGSTSGGSAGKGSGGKSGGGSSSGGKAQGGSDASGGDGASAGSSASGGVGGSGASGGDAANGGDAAGGGTSGAGGGGSGGKAGIPPDVLERAEVVLRYQAIATTASGSGSIQMRVYLENKTPDSLPLDELRVRYWMTAESPLSALVCDYASNVYGNSSNVHLEPVEDGDESHIEASFSGGRMLPTFVRDYNGIEFQIRADTDNAQGSPRLNQGNDYSFEPSFTRTDPPEPHDKITVYLAGKLIWGCEPSGRCPSTGEGGAGGEAGHAGEAGSGGTSGQGGTSGMSGQGGVSGSAGTAGSSGATGGGGQTGEAGEGPGGQAGEPGAGGA